VPEACLRRTGVIKGLQAAVRLGYRNSEFRNPQSEICNPLGAVPHPPTAGKSGKGEVCKTFMRRYARLWRVQSGPRLC